MATHSSISPWGRKESDTTEQLSTVETEWGGVQPCGVRSSSSRHWRIPRWKVDGPVIATHSGTRTHSEGRCRQWSACSLLHWWAQGRVSSQPRSPTDFCGNIIYLKRTAQAHIPRVLKPSLESVKGRYSQITAKIHHQNVSWLYTVAYTGGRGWRKDYKGNRLHRGLSPSFCRREILVWSLVFISLGGQFNRRYVIPMTTRHMVQSSLKVQDVVSFFFKMESAQPVPFLLHSPFLMLSTSSVSITHWDVLHFRFPGIYMGK